MGDMETRELGDTGTRRHVNTGTRGHGEAGKSLPFPFSLSPLLPFSPSPFLPFSLLLVALLSAAALGRRGPRPKALVLAWDDGGATAKALREAGLDAVVPPQQTVGSVDLGDVRLVVLSADVALPDTLAGRIAALVRGGGGLLVVHTVGTEPNFWWIPTAA